MFIGGKVLIILGLCCSWAAVSLVVSLVPYGTSADEEQYRGTVQDRSRPTSFASSPARVRYPVNRLTGAVIGSVRYSFRRAATGTRTLPTTGRWAPTSRSRVRPLPAGSISRAEQEGHVQHATTGRRLQPSTTPFAKRVRAYYYSPSAVARRRSCRKSVSPEGFEAALLRFEELCRQSPIGKLMRELHALGRLDGFKLRNR